MHWRDLSYKSDKLLIGPGMRRLAPDLSKLPVTVVQTRSLVSAFFSFFFLTLFGLFFLGVPALAMPAFQGIHLVFTIAFGSMYGLTMFGIVRSLATRRVVVFGTEGVSVTEPKGETWQANYADMIGVRYDEIPIRSSRSTFNFPVVELAHPDETKSVLLYAGKSGYFGIEETKTMPEHYAAQLGLKLIDRERDEANHSQVIFPLSTTRASISQTDYGHESNADALRDSTLVARRGWHWRQWLMKTRGPVKNGSLYLSGVNLLSSFRVDLSVLPVTTNIAPHLGSHFISLIFGSLFLFVLFFNLIAKGLSFGLGVFALIVLFAFGKYVFYPVFSILLQKRMATFSKIEVSVLEAGGEEWRCLYSRFDGLRHRTLNKKRARRGNSALVTYQVIELVHREREKTIPLYIAEGDELDPNILKAYGEVFRIDVVNAEPSVTPE